MATLTVVYLTDPGRVRLTLGAANPNVPYTAQRSVDGGATWVNVRGGVLATNGVTEVYDYEYTPNVENLYRILEPVFHDSFNRQYPQAGMLSLPGTAGAYASTPDAASLDITGDIDIRVEAQADSWSGTTQRALIAKSMAGNVSYRLVIDAEGDPRLIWSTDGTTLTQQQSGTPLPIASGRIAIRATLDVNNGAGSRVITFYTSNSIDGTWTVHTTHTIAGTTSIFSGTAQLEIGSQGGGLANLFEGGVFAAQVRNGIGGAIVANPRFIDQSAGTLSFADSTGKTWTINGDAEIIETFRAIGVDWGTADTGETWNVGTTSSGFNLYVNDGVGVVQSTAPPGNIASQTTDPIGGGPDVELTWSGTLPQQSLDVFTEFNTGIRALDNNNFYESQLFFDDDTAPVPRQVSIRIAKTVGGVYTGLTTTTAVGTWVPNIAWNMRFRVQGSTLYLRAWQVGTNEPRDWQVTANDTSLPGAGAVHMRARKTGGDPVTLWWGSLSAQTVPEPNVGATASITPVQNEVLLNSLAYPSLNRVLDCVDYQELTRDSRTGFFDIKGRHEILGVADVGSSATFSLTFVTRSEVENRAIVALLTYGGLMLLQPPGDAAEDCPTAFSGIPGGYVMVGGSSQGRTVYGQPLWSWTVEFTRVAAQDAAGIIPTTITWEQLWAIIGPDGTWSDAWALWSTWQEVWATVGSSDDFGGA